MALAFLYVQIMLVETNGPGMVVVHWQVVFDSDGSWSGMLQVVMVTLLNNVITHFLSITHFPNDSLHDTYNQGL